MNVCRVTFPGDGLLELRAVRLSMNALLIGSIRAFVPAGGVIYADGGEALYFQEASRIQTSFHRTISQMSFHSGPGCLMCLQKMPNISQMRS